MTDERFTERQGRTIRPLPLAPRSSRRVRQACGTLAVLCLPVVTACYSYAVTPAARIAPGTEVRARISAEQAERLRVALGGAGRTLEGELLEQSGDSVLLGVSRTILAQGSVNLRATQRVQIPRSELFELEVREVSWWKTGAVAFLAAGAVYYLIASDFAGLAAGGSGGTKTGPQR